LRPAAGEECAGIAEDHFLPRRPTGVEKLREPAAGVHVGIELATRRIKYVGGVTGGEERGAQGRPCGSGSVRDAGAVKRDMP